MKPCVAIFGPTGSGKSGLALRLAEKTNGVIVSADSMQIYRSMDVGTAKPTKEEMKRVPHRMIDVCDPGTTYSVFDFKVQAESAISEVLSENKIPFLVGGTGLYFDALFFNTDFGSFEVSDSLREELNQRWEQEGGSVLLRELCGIDPEAGASLHEKDRKRILRALEVYYTTGETITSYQKKSRRNQSEFTFLKLYLVYQSRDALYERIHRRVDQMMADGLLSEAKDLLDRGILSDTTAAQAIGYKEILPFLLGEKGLDDCILMLKQKTRNYAKRQMTWFRRYQDAFPIVMDGNDDPFETAFQKITEFLKDAGQ